MITIEEFKKKINQGSVVQRIANILVCIFILLLLPAVISGTYRAIVTTQQQNNVTPFQEQMMIYEKTGKVQMVINNLHEQIEVDNNVTVYAIEKRVNGVGEYDYYATIVANVGNFNSYKAKQFWQGQMIPPGYKYFNKELQKKGEWLISDITQEPKIYNGQTKVDCDYNGTRSLYGVLIVNNKEENEAYFIAVAFKFTDPLNESPYFRYRTKYAVKEIAEILKQ